MTYYLKCDEPHWVETEWVFDEDKETLEDTDREITDIMDDEVSYYWVESTERDEVLKVSDFIQGEEVVKRLTTGELEDFEQVEQEYEYAKVRSERPPQ